MTIRAMNWAWGIELAPALKLVLLKLADRANDDGECWPGNASIAQACCIGERTLIRYLAQLEALGLVEKRSRYDENGRRQSNVYLLDLDGSLSAKLAHGLSAKSDQSHVPTVADDKELKLFIETTYETTDATTKVAAPVEDSPVRYDGERWQVEAVVYDGWVVAFQNGRTNRDTEDWIEAELAKAALWLQANPRKRKKNYLRFMTNWLCRALDPKRRQGKKPAQATRHAYH